MATPHARVEPSRPHVYVDPERFWRAHAVFKRFAEERAGVPFSHRTGFDHPFLVNTETAYKWNVAREANELLRFPDWAAWRSEPGRILDAVRAACDPRVASNLLDRRYPETGSRKPLYRVSPDDVHRLEARFYEFFDSGRDEPSRFPAHFDALAEHLRSERLGCQWRFVSYLAFLAKPDSYFPFLPTEWDKLLRFYGSDVRVTGSVSWERYLCVLELGEVLRDFLAGYGTASSVQIQSYMFVVSYLLPEIEEAPPKPAEPNFDEELRRRIHEARNRERNGLIGERFVYQGERTHLAEEGRTDLSDRVELVSAKNSDAGFDVLSFHVDGRERHIEVKSTSLPRSRDRGFWLTEKERLRAEKDERWTLMRVWDVLSANPVMEDLGNVERSTGWRRSPQTWYIEPVESTQGRGP